MTDGGALLEGEAVVYRYTRRAPTPPFSYPVRFPVPYAGSTQPHPARVYLYILNIPPSPG
jgi:hypothetical protein